MATTRDSRPIRLPSRIDRLLERQRSSLQSLDDRQARAFMRAYEDGRRELRDRIQQLEQSGQDTNQRFTAQHLRVMLAQAEDGIRQLNARLATTLDEQVKVVGERALEDLLAVIAKAEPEFRDTGGRIDQELLAAVTEERGLLVHRYSTQRYSAEVLADIQRTLSLGVVQGKTIPQMRDQLFRQQGAALASKPHRAELIVRMELNGAYNRQHQAAAVKLAELTDVEHDNDPLMRRADEYTDLRNNAISRALDGRVAKLTEPWRVSVAEVQAANAQLNAARAARGKSPRRVSGIVWPKVGGAYVGMVFPAHYNDRGRQVPFRRSWSED